MSDFVGFLNQTRAGVDDGPSGGSSMCRPGSDIINITEFKTVKTMIKSKNYKLPVRIQNTEVKEQIQNNLIS